MRAPIIVGLDDTDNTDGTGLILGWAAQEARLHGLPLRLVHSTRVLADDGSLTEEGYARLRVDRTSLLEGARERLAVLAPGVEVTTHLLEQDPGRALVTEADEGALVVVGTRGSGGFDGLLFGSVGLHVAAHARCPVLVVPATAPPAPGAATHSPAGSDRTQDRAADRTAGEIVVGVDERHVESRAIEWAFQEASLRGAKLTAIHAVGGEFGAPRQRVGEDLLLAEALAGRAPDHPDVPVTRVAAQETPAHALVRASEGADMVVVGARRRHGLRGMVLGRVNHAVLHHARCPVVVVPED